MRYELFHLCLAELIYESKGKPIINSLILNQISKIHEQLFKIGIKNLSNIFQTENYISEIIFTEKCRSLLVHVGIRK